MQMNRFVTSARTFSGTQCEKSLPDSGGQIHTPRVYNIVSGNLAALRRNNEIYQARRSIGVERLDFERPRTRGLP